MYILSMLGPPGAGKGTLAQQLCAALDLVHLSTGDLLRRLAREETLRGQEFRCYISAGIAPPDESITPVVLDMLSVRGGPCERVLFDGFPRTFTQAHALDETLKTKGASTFRVLYIYISPEEAIARLLCRWSCPQCGTSYTLNGPAFETQECRKCGGGLVRRWGDGDPEILHARRGVFYKDTGPVLEYYRQRGQLYELNGEMPATQIAAHVLDTLRGDTPLGTEV